jgi:putative flippase GtrA
VSSKVELTNRIRTALSRQEVRFIVVGSSGALLFFTLSFALVSAGMAPFFGSALAYAICFITVYATHRSWTFSSVNVPHGKALPRYFLLQAFCAVMSGLVAHFLVSTFGFAPLAMSALTAIAAAGFSYFVSSLWVFIDR